jgi:hypothetical protein
MPLLNPLYVIVDTKENQGIVNANRIREIERFTNHMSRMPGGKIVFAQSIIGPLPNMHRGTRESDPNWTFLPDMDLRVQYLYRGITNRAPGSFDQFLDIEEKNVNIILYCRDKTAPNIIAIFDRIKKYIADYKPLKGAELEYRLAGGAVGVQAAINETLTYWQPITHYLALLMVFIFCTLLFRSFIAGIVIMIPLYISTTLAYAFMVLNNPPLPLTTATLPVASVGIGLGVDYGIYLVSRLIEEFKNTGSYEEAVIATLGTTGKAIFYSATTLMCGLVFWFFSKLMFQALMGLLLAIILVINMLGALLMIPSIVLILKPKFLKTRSEQL